MTRTRLLGHRGARARAPENTLVSLRRALADGAAGFEFDVRATADGHAVLLHDETVDRTTDGTGRLAAMTLEQVRALDAGAAFGGAAHPGERVPTLDQVLDEFLGKTALALEMKETLPNAVLRALGERLAGAPEALRDDRLVVASFQAPAVARARDLVPAAPRARILHRDEPIPDAAERAALHLWGVFARWESVDARFLAACREANLRCYAYTVNDPEAAAELARLGTDGIISDDPGKLRVALR